MLQLHRGLGGVVVTLAFVLTMLQGQTLPPSQYPPSTYPPGQYPPGQYPPNTIPGRLPGGVGVGIPVPEIRLPRRDRSDKGDGKTQDRKGEMTISLANIDGTLRRMGEKDLLLETSKGIFRFRLLAKTQFRDKKGDPVRDSLLKPGDQLQVAVNGDDKETALRVILLRAGTPAERQTASRPVSPSVIKTPDGLGELRTDAGPEEDERPILQRRPDRAGPEGTEAAEPGVRVSAPRTREGRVAVGDESVLFDKVEPVIAEAREAAEGFSDKLPNFVVQQYTTRYVSTTYPAQWRAVDIVQAEVAVVRGREEYRNVTINGKPSKRPVENTGSWSTGEFVTTLQDLLSPMTDAAFVKRREDLLANHPALVYDFSVTQPNSHWRIIPEHGPSYQPAYKGSVWIEKETHRVLRIEMRALSIPNDFPFDKVESILEYDVVRLDGETHLLPTHSENLMCQRGARDCTRNEIEFRNYRKFTADSSIQFEKN